VEKLVSQLEEGRRRSIENLAAAGLQPLAQPRGGMFVSAGWDVPPAPAVNGRSIADLALKSGILLSPGEFFMLRPCTSIWFRFNAAYSDSPQLRQFLQSVRPS
jgi:DNA-binding transcriptional MocR family regulator